MLKDYLNKRMIMIVCMVCLSLGFQILNSSTVVEAADRVLFDAPLDISGSYLIPEPPCIDSSRPCTGAVNQKSGTLSLRAISSKRQDPLTVFEYAGTLVRPITLLGFNLTGSKACEGSWAVSVIDLEYTMSGNIKWAVDSNTDKFEMRGGVLNGVVIPSSVPCGLNVASELTISVDLCPEAISLLDGQPGDAVPGCLQLVIPNIQTPFTGFNVDGCSSAELFASLPEVGMTVSCTLRSPSNPFISIPSEPLSVKGKIEGQVKSDKAFTVVNNETSFDVEQATVTLWKQKDGFIRAQLPGESDEAFQTFLQSKKITPKSETINPDEDGKFSFDDVALFELAGNGGSKFTLPVYYTLEVTNAESKELIRDTDFDFDPENPDNFRTLYFASNTSENIRPDKGTVTVSLIPFDGIGAKLGLVNTLGTSSFSNYIPDEVAVEIFINELAGDPEKMTPEIQEGLKRAILAERVVRDGVIFADQLLEILLKGLGTVVADAFDDIVNLLRGESKLDKEIAQVESMKSAFPRGLFGVDPTNPGLSFQFTNHLKKLTMTKELVESLDDLNKVLKFLSIALIKKFEESGMESEKAEKIVGLTQKSLNVLLRTIKESILSQGSRTSSVSGALQGLVKIAIEEGVNLAKPLLLDDLVLPSYTLGTRPFLHDSVKRFKEWDKVELEQYTKDRDNVVSIQKELGDVATNVIIDAHAFQESAAVLDLIQDGLEIAGSVVKQAKVIATIVQAFKYIDNAVSIVLPFKAVYWDINGFVEEGTLKSFGEDVPVSASSLNHVPLSRQEVSTTNSKYRSKVNTKLLSLIMEAGDELEIVLSQLIENLENDDIGASLELTGGDSPGGYINRLFEWEQKVSMFFTQISGINVTDTSSTVADNLMDISIENLELNGLLADLAEMISDLYFKVLTLEFEGSNDPLYIAERNNILSVISSTISNVEHFEQSLNDLVLIIEDMEFLPAIAVQVSSLISNETSGDTITLSPEVFTLSVNVRNISDVDISALSAEVTVISPKSSFEISPTLEVPVDIGSLEADDGLDGSGKDEKEIEWAVQYSGDLSSESLFFSVNILENGEEQLTFVSNTAQNILSVDSSLADKDFDFMPDDWERSNGLDDTKDDSESDKDNDGLTNLRELELGTDPQNLDADGDGLSDWEETTGGEDGFVTDPLNADTDDDGVPDGSDGQPVDGGTNEKPNPEDILGEAEVSVDKTDVAITKEERIATISVTNSGEGTLTWTSVSDNDAIAVVSPDAFDLRNGDGLVVVSAPAGYDFDTPGKNVTTIKVFDVVGATKDFKEITVKVGEGDERKPPEGDGSGGEDDDGDGDGSEDDDGDDDGGGNDCSVQNLLDDETVLEDKETLSINKRKSLKILRGYRDTVLSKTQKGISLIKLYYKYSSEVTEIINADPELKAQSTRVLKKLVMVMQGNISVFSILDVEKNTIPLALEYEINGLIDYIAKQGSDELKTATEQARVLLKNN